MNTSYHFAGNLPLMQYALKLLMADIAASLICWDCQAVTFSMNFVSGARWHLNAEKDDAIFMSNL